MNTEPANNHNNNIDCRNLGTTNEKGKLQHSKIVYFSNFLNRIHGVRKFTARGKKSQVKEIGPTKDL